MNILSTDNLQLIPSPSKLQKICKSLSALEAIISPEWEYRYYSYQKDWSETEEFCEMRDGGGDHVLIVFSEYGTCINGFAHESMLNGWKTISIVEEKSFIQRIFSLKKNVKTELKQEITAGILDKLPQVFSEFIFGEPVKSIGTTFCIWQTQENSKWQMGNVKLPNDNYKDGSSELLHLLDGNPLSFKNWAEEYYEGNFDNNELRLEFVEEVFNGSLITKQLVLAINPELKDFEKLQSDLDEIGYEHKF